MNIEFSSPFAKETGLAGLTLALKRPVTLKELIRLVAGQCAPFDKYASMEDDATLTSHLAFVRSGRILLPSDLVKDEDRVMVFLPATGG